MEYLAQFIGLAAIALLGAMSPGADFVLVTRNAFVHSRSVGVYTAIGIGLGVLVHVMYTLAGIGLIISQSIVLFSIIKFLGAAYLIFLGWQSLQAKPRNMKNTFVKIAAKNTLTPMRAIFSGVATNALNPKVTLFFLSLFTQFISAGMPFIVQVGLGLEAAMIIGGWFMFVAFLFSNSVLKERLYLYGHWFDRIMGVALIGLGIKVALSVKE